LKEEEKKKEQHFYRSETCGCFSCVLLFPLSFLTCFLVVAFWAFDFSLKAGTSDVNLEMRVEDP